MRYHDVSEYLPIADAVPVLCARGLTETEAKEDLALALRDGAVCCRVWRSYRGQIEVKFVPDLDIKAITVDCIDWQTSAIRLPFPFGGRRYDTLEICRAHMDRIWTATDTKPRRGRRKGDGEKDDTPALAHMKQEIDATDGNMSVRKSAKLAANKYWKGGFPGATSRDSYEARLKRKFPSYLNSFK